jgi:uncharacterized repeat protein (TIGR01451 family)
MQEERMNFRIIAVVAALAFVAVATFGRGATPVSAQDPGPDISIVCPASAAVGSSFTCDIVLSDDAGNAATDFAGYGIGVSHDSAELTSVPGSWTQAAIWGSVFDLNEDYNQPFAFGGNDSRSHIARAAGVGQAASDFRGTLATLDLTCESAGTHDVLLITLAASPVFGTHTVDQVGNEHDNVLHDTQVACQVAATITKVADPTPASPGAPIEFTITVDNSTGSNMTDVSVTDVFDPAFTNLAIVSEERAGVASDECDAGNATGNGSFDALGAGEDTLFCDGGFTLLDGQDFVVVVSGEVDPDQGAGIVQNCVEVTSIETGTQTVCINIEILPSGVVWHKEFVECDEQGENCVLTGETAANLFLTDSGSITFAEVMTNQPDPAGLGAFEFQIHYNNAIWQQPDVNLQPAIDLFLNGGNLNDPGYVAKDLDCTINHLETQVHVFCVSVGLDVGPIWSGPEILALVTFTPKNLIVQSIKPAKFNGVVAWIKNTHIEAANVFGQPLNDGSSGFGQGNLVPGILPGGQVDAGDPEVVVTIRRLEGDVTKDCTVDVGDLQAMASRFGTKLGSLLYNAWFDLEPHQPTSGDGDIDVKDIQFVFGRFGSTCEDPIGNPQLPETHPSMP